MSSFSPNYFYKQWSGVVVSSSSLALKKLKVHMYNHNITHLCLFILSIFLIAYYNNNNII